MVSGSARFAQAALARYGQAIAFAVGEVLCGQGDIVQIAWALHRRVREPGRPFIVAGPRRGGQPESVRSPASRGNVVLALEAARRGTCCMRLRRKPADLAEVVPLLRAADDVMLVICGGSHLASDALLIRPAPVVVPPLASRAHELERIVDEYAADASAELQATLTDADRDWVLRNAATSLDEIHKGHVPARRGPYVAQRQSCGGAVGDGDGVAVEVARPPRVAVDDALRPRGPPMIRAIPCRIGGKPCMTYLDNPSDGYAAAVEGLLRSRGPVARLPLFDGLELCCDRNGLLLGPRARPPCHGGGSARPLVLAARTAAE